MTEEEKEEIRVIIREEIVAFLHEVETMTGQGDSPNIEGDTNTARGLLRLLFNQARNRRYKDML